MTTCDTRVSPGAALSRTAPSDGISRVGLALLVRAFAYAHDVGGDPWDFALEVDRLYESGLTISDLRWLVAKGFAEHGHEASVYGSPHRSFRRGTGFCFDRATCVVLTPGGAAFVDELLDPPAGSPRTVPPTGTAPVAAREAAAPGARPPADEGHAVIIPVVARPCWNATRRELSLRGTVVKRFRVPAHNQELILAAFEEEGWPEHVDDPLKVSHAVDPRTRLHDAINRLNCRQTHPLLRFRGNGNGTGVFWELRQAESCGLLEFRPRAVEGDRLRGNPGRDSRTSG